jgi:hypothetical protein
LDWEVLVDGGGDKTAAPDDGGNATGEALGERVIEAITHYKQNLPSKNALTKITYITHLVTKLQNPTTTLKFPIFLSP